MITRRPRGPVPRFPTGSAARDLLWVQKAGAGDAHRRSRPSHQILPGVRIGGSGKSSRGNFATLKVVDQQPLARRRIAGMPPGGDRIRPWRVSHQNTLGPAFNRNRRRWKTFHFGAGCKIGTCRRPAPALRRPHRRALMGWPQHNGCRRATQKRSVLKESGARRANRGRTEDTPWPKNPTTGSTE